MRGPSCLLKLYCASYRYAPNTHVFGRLIEKGCSLANNDLLQLCIWRCMTDSGSLMTVLGRSRSAVIVEFGWNPS